MRRALLILAPLLLAGCTQVTGALDDIRDVAALARSAVDQRGCRESVASFAYPAAAFSSYVPPGLALQPADPSASTATVLWWARHCDAVGIVGGPLAGDVGPQAELWGFVLLLPPDAGDPSVTYALPFYLALANETVAETYRARGLDAILRPGSVIVHEQDALGGLPSWRLEAPEGDGRLVIETRGGSSTAARAPDMLRVVLGTSDGILGSFDIASTGGDLVVSSGRASLRQPAQPPAHEGEGRLARGVDALVGPLQLGL